MRATGSAESGSSGRPSQTTVAPGHRPIRHQEKDSDCAAASRVRRDESVARPARKQPRANIFFSSHFPQLIHEPIYFPRNKIAYAAVLNCGGNMSQLSEKLLDADGIDRRGFLRCMAWAGSGVVWSFAGGVPTSKLLGQTVAEGAFQFVQISDSHIGFNKPANADVNATLQIAIDKINALPKTPDFLIHTGDLTHLAKPSEF